MKSVTLIRIADAEARIATKLATGKFTDTGAKYTPVQTQCDACNAALRLTAMIDADGKLIWKKE